MVDIILIIAFLILGVGIVSLQLYLSKKENKWLGLILPIISFLLSAIIVVGVIMITIYSPEVLDAIEAGWITGQATHPALDNPDVVMTGVMAFVIFNLPTIVLLIIYKVIRNTVKQELELDYLAPSEVE